MIIVGRVLRADGPDRAWLEPARIQVEGARIRAVEWLDEPASAGDLGGRETLILPGFVDCHLHLPQFDSVGADGMTLLDWLETVVFPAEVRWDDPSFAGAMATRVATTLLSHGTTGVAAYGTVHHDGTRAAMHAMADAGLRGVLGQVLMDQRAPTELIRPAAQLLDEASALVGAGRMEPAVTPRFALTCSAELLAGAGRLAGATGQAVQTHLSEMEPECELARELHDAPSYTDVYRRAGLLTQRTLLGHGIYLDDAERSAIADTGATVAHCPTSNLFLQSGKMDGVAHASRGVQVCLGSDVAGGPDVSMVRVARSMIETSKRFGDGRPIPSPHAAWWQITRGNAEIMGWSDAGVIEPGAAADLVLVSHDLSLGPGMDELSAMLYGWDDRWITQTVVEGRVGYDSAAR